MHILKSTLALLAGSQLAYTIALDRTPLPKLEERDGCPDGQYLLYSASAGPICLSRIGLGIALVITLPTAGLIAVNIKAAWTSNTPAPYPATVPAPAESEERRALGARDNTVTAYNLELYPGYDYHDANNPDTDDDWTGLIRAAIQYMSDEQVECLKFLVYGDATNYENQVTIWLETSDGADHRSC